MKLKLLTYAYRRMTKYIYETKAFIISNYHFCIVFSIYNTYQGKNYYEAKYVRDKLYGIFMISI